MSTRYFKATDGERTFFRASPSRVYQSLTVDGSNWVMHRDGRGRFPAVEITRQEYVALTAQKAARFAKHKADWQAANPEIAAKARWYVLAGTAPHHSWVANSDLEA